MREKREDEFNGEKEREETNLTVTNVDINIEQGKKGFDRTKLNS